jgi:peptidoglycan/LPS O-acetylase OafA/YrhL
MTMTDLARPEAATAPARRVRLLALDGLRLVCALAVAGYHFGDSWRLDGVQLPRHFLPTGAPVLIYGFLGVEVFFLISGFVICMSGWGRTVREFAASRAARLYPAFWGCVLLTTVVVIVLPVTGGLPVSGIPSAPAVAVNLSMLAEPLNKPLVDTVYWTLWIEFRFYLIFACLLGAGLTDRRVRAFGTVWLVTAVAMPLFPGALLNQLVMPDFAPYFVAGMTMFLLRRDRADWRLWALLSACWLVSLQRVQVRTHGLHPGFVVPVWPAMVLLTLAYAVLLAIALGLTDRLGQRWLATAGALTYPFYLLHQRVGYSLIRTVWQHTGLPLGVLLPGAVIVLLATAWAVHRIVERPLAPRVKAFVLGRASVRPGGR